MFFYYSRHEICIYEGTFNIWGLGRCWGVYFIVHKPWARRPRSLEAAQRYFVCSAPYHFDARGRTLPHMPLIIINFYNNEYNINILFIYILLLYNVRVLCGECGNTWIFINLSAMSHWCPWESITLALSSTSGRICIIWSAGTLSTKKCVGEKMRWGLK